MNGSRANNIIAGLSSENREGASVWYDPHASLGGSFVSQADGGHHGVGPGGILLGNLGFGVSADGTNWSKAVAWCASPQPLGSLPPPPPPPPHLHPSRWVAGDCYEVQPSGQRGGGCDTQTSVFWDHRLSQYAMYTRNLVSPPGGGFRSVRRLQAETLRPGNLSEFEGEEQVLQPDAVDNSSHPGPCSNTTKGFGTLCSSPFGYYGAPVWQYPQVSDGGIYFAFAHRYWHWQHTVRFP